MIDINLNEGSPVVSSEPQLLIQQIDILFDTFRNELLGAPSYGTDYDEFLYNLNLSNDAIAHRIETDLAQLNLLGFIPAVEVNILEGTLNDIILVKVSLTKDDDTYEKIYKLT